MSIYVVAYQSGSYIELLSRQLFNFKYDIMIRFTIEAQYNRITRVEIIGMLTNYFKFCVLKPYAIEKSSKFVFFVRRHENKFTCFT